jgi:Bacterial archaeo-eukaryotic release factor family 3
MNRHDVRLLQAVQTYPCVSILLPTHRTAPDNRQDPIRVKNLVNEATNRLLTEFSQREIATVLARLDALVAEIDYRYTLDGLALFANQDIGREFPLPFAPRERVVVDATFATRDLVYTLNRSPRYWVLALSEQPTRLYEGSRDTLVEVRDAGFPLTHSGPGGATRLPGGIGVNRSAYRDGAHRQFFRKVDSVFGEIAADDELPVAVAGVDRLRAFFDEVTSHGSDIIAAVAGSYDSATPHELAQLVWPPVQDALAERRAKALDELDAAVGALRSASGIQQVWPTAQEGRGSKLLVEQDFHYRAEVDASGLRLLPEGAARSPEALDDAVDEVIEKVLEKGGSVVFTDPGTLSLHQQIALILRY